MRGPVPAPPAQSPAEYRRPGVWRQEVQARARRIEDAALQFSGNRTNGTSGRIGRLLGVARQASKDGGFRRWWNGTLIERAWLALHDAEVELVSSMDDTNARLWWDRVTRPSTPRSGNNQPRKPPKNRTEAAESLRAYYDQSDELFEATRTLRNRLISLTLIGTVLTALLLIIGCLGDWRINDRTAVTVAGVPQFLLVALFGVIGAFISGLPALSRMPRQLSPSWTAPYQLWLKLAIGPVFALIGVMMLDARLLDVAHPVVRFGDALLLWAAIFGSAQQLITGLLDRKASGLAAANAETAHTRRADGADMARLPVWIPAQATSDKPQRDGLLAQLKGLARR